MICEGLIFCMASSSSSLKCSKSENLLETERIMIVPKPLLEKSCWYSMFPSILINTLMSFSRSYVARRNAYFNYQFKYKL